MATGAAVNIAATVSNDPANAGVNWTMSCTPGTGGTCGSSIPRRRWCLPRL
jgi:hypothetical protein